MLYPSLETVRELAAQYNTIPVFFTFPADHRTPISIFTALSQDEETAFLLESVNNGSQWDRYSFIGFHPEREFKAFGASMQVTRANDSQTMTVDDPFAFLQKQLDAQTSPKTADFP